jgi:hypothetical protein
MCASASRLRLFAAHRLDVHLERQLDVLRQAAPAHSFVASELPIQKTIVKTACENPDFRTISGAFSQCD